MDLQLFFAIFCAKIIRTILVVILRSGATAAPGLIALKIDKNLIYKLSKKIPEGAILVSGTNGKTTTSRLIYDLLASETRVMHNRQGSNLERGIASTLSQYFSIFGNTNYKLAIWEVDEATFPQVAGITFPKVIILLNLFRDQLDRYGEVDSVREKWKKTIEKIKSSTLLLLNADDPGISTLAAIFRGKTFFYGVEDKKIDLPKIEDTADVKFCLSCGAKLAYTSLFSSHMGHYQCANCGLTRPITNSFAEKIVFGADFSVYFTWSSNSVKEKIKSNLPGLYNVYNVLAAISCAKTLGVSSKIAKAKVEVFTAAFGRYQKTSIKEKIIYTFLIKNPAGANETIRTINSVKSKNLLIILNDKIADGRDVSWIWDTNWEGLTNTTSIYFSGKRAWDIANRLKYAGHKLSNNSVHEDINYSILNIIKSMNTKDTLFILPTYTSLLEVQKTLSKMGQQHWKLQ